MTNSDPHVSVEEELKQTIIRLRDELEQHESARFIESHHLQEKHEHSEELMVKTIQALRSQLDEQKEKYQSLEIQIETMKKAFNAEKSRTDRDFQNHVVGLRESFEDQIEIIHKQFELKEEKLQRETKLLKATIEKLREQLEATKPSSILEKKE